MKVAVVQETCAGERRVALVPAVIPTLTKAGCEVVVQAGAGTAAGYPDDSYLDKGARIVDSREEAFRQADVVTMVRTAGAAPGTGSADPLSAKQTVIGMCDPLGSPQAAQEFAATGATLFALELIPRITRAQSMDVLSSMATVAGYRAVLLAATELPRMFPLLMTAAGTVSPAKVFVIGGGVAGLQAIATARRLGAVVHAYDVRPAVREQVESLGGKFVVLPLDTGETEDKGGYAKELGEDFYRRQRELLAQAMAGFDVVIATAAIPGKPSPLLITEPAVQGLPPGSVIVDLAAERGGNCQLSQPDQRLVSHGVTILGPTNLPSDIPYHASQMYAKNITTFLLNMVRDGQWRIDMQDEIIRDTLVAREGQLVHPRLRELLGMPQLAPQDPQESSS